MRQRKNNLLIVLLCLPYWTIAQYQSDTAKNFSLMTAFHVSNLPPNSIKTAGNEWSYSPSLTLFFKNSLYVSLIDNIFPTRNTLDILGGYSHALGNFLIDAFYSHTISLSGEDLLTSPNFNLHTGYYLGYFYLSNDASLIWSNEFYILLYPAISAELRFAYLFTPEDEISIEPAISIAFGTLDTRYSYERNSSPDEDFTPPHSQMIDNKEPTTLPPTWKFQGFFPNLTLSYELRHWECSFNSTYVLRPPPPQNLELPPNLSNWLFSVGLSYTFSF